MDFVVAKLTSGNIRVLTVEEYRDELDSLEWEFIESIIAESREEAAFKFGIGQVRDNCAFVVEALLSELGWELDGLDGEKLFKAIKSLLEVLNIQSFNGKKLEDTIKIFQDKQDKDSPRYIFTANGVTGALEEVILESELSPGGKATLEEVELDYWDK